MILPGRSYRPACRITASHTILLTVPNRTAVLLAGGVVASLALAAVIYVVARPSEVSSQVSVHDGGTVNLRGVTLTVPANAVTSDGRLVASTVDPPPVPDVSDAHGAAVRLAADRSRCGWTARS